MKLLEAHESLFYPILQRYGFQGSKVSDQAELDDFDAAVRKWGKSETYRRKVASVVRASPPPKPKSREERQYEDAKDIIRRMNSKGYTRAEVNEELEDAGLMDDLVSHGFEKVGRWSTTNAELEYKPQAIKALSAFIGRYEAAHNIRNSDFGKRSIRRGGCRILQSVA